MIESRGLLITWPGGVTLRYPDLQLGSGQALLLRGPSGSGKSTWLALMAGLLTPTQGMLVVNGVQPGQLTQAARDAWRSRTIGFLPQGARLSPALSVADNLRLAAFASGHAPEPAHQQALIKRLGLLPLLRHRTHQLSGGQALRVALARALLLRPAILLADEPTASLDDDHAQAAMQLLREQAERHGTTLIVATHDQRAVAALPDALHLHLGGAA